jgi:histidyl-tRNA synthetase
MHCGGGGPKAQFRRADRSGSAYALVLGEAELARGVVGLKPLRAAGEQEEIATGELAATLAARLRAE